MAERPKNVRRGGSGEATAAPDAHGTWGAIKRHRKSGGPLCESCADHQRTYNRDYYRQARRLEAFRQRHNAHHRQYTKRTYADPAKVAQMNARRRQTRLASLDAARRAARLDEVVIARLTNGEPAQHNRHERLEAVRQLRSRGTSYPQIAERLRVGERQVHRDLVALGLVNSTGAVA